MKNAAVFNPLNAKIVVANFSCNVKVVFVKEKRWLCQGIEAPCNALVSVLRLYLNVYRLLTAITYFLYTHIMSCALLTTKAPGLEQQMLFFETRFLDILKFQPKWILRCKYTWCIHGGRFFIKI